jgi:hypothetical protein
MQNEQAGGTLAYDDLPIDKKQKMMDNVEQVIAALNQRGYAIGQESAANGVVMPDRPGKTGVLLKPIMFHKKIRTKSRPLRRI